MRAELRRLDSADAIEGLKAYAPDDPLNFRLTVGAMIGPAGEAGEEVFYFSVCSASWLQQNPPPKGFEFLRHTLLLSRWDYDVLTRGISDLCHRTEGSDWHELAAKLARYGAWEFEDYRDGS